MRAPGAGAPRIPWQVCGRPAILICTHVSGAPSTCSSRAEAVRERGAGRAAIVICNQAAEFVRIGGGAAIRICDHGAQFACVEDGAAMGLGSLGAGVGDCTAIWIGNQSAQFTGGC